MAHLSCVGETAEGLAETLDQIEAAGIENVFALRGDPPRGEEDFVQPEGGLGSAAELAAFIDSRWSFTVGGACFPEVHPEAPDLETDLAYLKTKVEAGASFLITQLFFDNQVYFDFVAAARAAGIEVPIIAGVIPVASFAQTKRICNLCDASIPPRLEAAFAAAGGDETGRVRARRRLRRPAVLGAAPGRGARHPLLRAQPGAGDAGGARLPAGGAALGARPQRQRRLGQVTLSKLPVLMANRREEERERLRQARQEREKHQAGSEKRRLMIGYGVAGLVGIAVLVGIVVVIVSAASKNDSGNAHINQQSGSTNGIQPDTRSGTDGGGGQSHQPQRGGEKGRLRPAPATSPTRGAPTSRRRRRRPNTKPTRRPPATTSNRPTSRPTAPTRKCPGNSTSCTRSSTAGWRSSTRRTSPRAPSWN